MPGLATEVVANSNSQILVFSGNVFSNVQANGTGYRVTASGFTSPAGGVNQTLQPSVALNVYFGSLGTSADPLVMAITIPPQNAFNEPNAIDGPVGNFVYDGLLTLRKNLGSSAVAGGNVTVSAATINPFGVQMGITSNGNANVVNVALTSNTAGNVSVYGVASGLGQAANLVFEQCVITVEL